ncbi:MAG: endonuclease SmrB [Arsenophonus sp.]
MKNKFKLSDEEIKLFKEATTDIKPLLHDIVNHSSSWPQQKKEQFIKKYVIKEQLDTSYYFSDEYQPALEVDGPTRYLRSDVNSYELKKLRRSNYIPKIFLDLHGLSQGQTKQKIGTLIEECYKNNTYCACIVHGHGKDILKKKVPFWLAQHPKIIAFHQAPKIWGGSASLLILVETNET